MKRLESEAISSLPQAARPGRAIGSVLAIGVIAALGVGKLPPVLLSVSDEFGLTLVQASFLVSLFQLAGAAGGLFAGTLADRFGHRRVMQTGLAILLGSTLLGACAPSAGWLLASRAAESVGFILAVLPAPAMLAGLVPVERQKFWLGGWGTFMPAGVMIGLVVAPWIAYLAGWRGVWVAHAMMLTIAWWALRKFVSPPRSRIARLAEEGFWPMLKRTCATSGPWLLASSFGAYAGQYLCLIAFLPTIYQQAGLSVTSAGALTALVAGINVVGNILAGALIQRGVNPGLLLGVAALALMAGSWIVFGSDWPFVLRYASVVATSAVCGLIPGTLFVLAPRFAPSPMAVSGTVGLMQQGSGIGQMVLPPLVAWTAMTAGGWQNSWLVIGAFALVNLMLGMVIGSRHAKRPD